jgi:hypothetical protein
MTQALQSYSGGRWQDGAGEQRALLDAATGEVATIPARGPDMAAISAVRHYMQRTAVQGHPDLLATLVPEGEEQP